MHSNSFLSTALRILLVIACLLAVVSCARSPAHLDWSYADLRLLDPLDNTAPPSTDILGVYTRTIGFDLEIRIDLLDIPVAPDYDLRLFLTTPAGELTIYLPATGRPVVTPVEAGIQVRLIRDPWLDTITVRLNRLTVPQPFTLQVASFVPRDSTPVDETIPVRSDALPPLTRAPLLLAFWNTYPVATPAQALRRWDGAHTGPRGERHGLRHILDAAAQYHIPLALLDLKTPASLAALSYMGVLPQIQTLSSQDLLILPDVAYAEPAQVSLGFSSRAAAGFGLPASQFVYSASSNLQSGYLAQFLPLDDTSRASHSAGTRLIPLPVSGPAQATMDGPSLDVRRQLVTAAFSADPSRLVVLGGDLPTSTWGNQDMAAPTFAWIADHPWIQPLTGDDLITFPLGTQANLPSQGNEASPADSVAPYLHELKNAPDNPLTASAWQTWLMLTAPTRDDNFRALRADYFGQVGELLAASRWAQDPYEYADCSNDLNGDGQPECVLSSRNFFAILDPRGGRLSDLFYLDAAGPHQLVGPSSQFTVGLSDPSEWHPGQGEAADPGVILGAFSDGTARWEIRTPVGSDGITFIGPDSRQTKTYHLTGSGLSVSYKGFGPVNTSIPLAVDPQAFYNGPAKYQSASAPGVWIWGLVHGIKVKIHSDANLSAQSFTDSQAFLPGPENPDQAYPGGHYLPFPLSVVTVQSLVDFNVQITIK